MAADKITYCLTHLTDYVEFERFCCAFLSGLGYPKLEPMGGSNDGGRDALIRFEDGRLGVFAFSAQAEWKAKLRSVCERVKLLWPGTCMLVFACTSSITARDKDWAHNYVFSEYAWRLELYDLHSLSMHLKQSQRHLLLAHPSIFTLGPSSDYSPGARKCAQDFLTANKYLLAELQSADAELAVEIDEGDYKMLQELLVTHKPEKLATFHAEVRPMIETVHQALLAIWRFFSDGRHYVVQYTRVKFDNTWRQGAPNPQAILAEKKTELSALLRAFRDALAVLEFAAEETGHLYGGATH